MGKYRINVWSDYGNENPDPETAKQRFENRDDAIKELNRVKETFEKNIPFRHQPTLYCAGSKLKDCFVVTHNNGENVEYKVVPVTPPVTQGKIF